MAETTTERKNPKFQTRHYEAVAMTLVFWREYPGRTIPDSAYESLVAYFCALFKDDNPGFKAALFYRACKVEGYG